MSKLEFDPYHWKAFPRLWDMMLQSCLMNSLGKPHLWMVKASAVCGCNTLIETQHESDPVV